MISWSPFSSRPFYLPFTKVKLDIRFVFFGRFVLFSPWSGGFSFDFNRTEVLVYIWKYAFCELYTLKIYIYIFLWLFTFCDLFICVAAAVNRGWHGIRFATKASYFNRLLPFIFPICSLFMMPRKDWLEGCKWRQGQI